MDNHLLSFAVNEECTMISLHADIGRLNLMIDSLVRLRDLVAAGKCEDLHFFADEALGGELTSTMLTDSASEARVAQHVKVYGWTEEWAKRHGLLR